MCEYMTAVLRAVVQDCRCFVVLCKLLGLCTQHDGEWNARVHESTGVCTGTCARLWNHSPRHKARQLPLQPSTQTVMPTWFSFLFCIYLWETHFLGVIRCHFHPGMYVIKLVTMQLVENWENLLQLWTALIVEILDWNQWYLGSGMIQLSSWQVCCYIAAFIVFIVIFCNVPSVTFITTLCIMLEWHWTLANVNFIIF